MVQDLGELRKNGVHHSTSVEFFYMWRTCSYELTLWPGQERTMEPIEKKMEWSQEMDQNTPSAGHQEGLGSFD